MSCCWNDDACDRAPPLHHRQHLQHRVVDVAGQAAEVGNHLPAGCRIGGEVLLGFGFEEELREAGGGDLETDLGELAGVGFAQVLDQIVLEEAVFEGAVLLGAPFFVTAAGFPVGDVARIRAKFGDIWCRKRKTTNRHQSTRI